MAAMMTGVGSQLSRKASVSLSVQSGPCVSVNQGANCQAKKSRFLQ